MPPIFLRTTRAGIPSLGVAVSFCFGLLAFLSLNNGSDQVFLWLSDLSALSSLVCWISICICYIHFKRALDCQGESTGHSMVNRLTRPPGINRHRLTLRSWFQPYIAWICIIAFSLVLLCNGFTSFLGGFAVSDFFASYVTLPFIGLCFVGWKFGSPYLQLLW